MMFDRGSSTKYAGIAGTEGAAAQAEAAAAHSNADLAANGSRSSPEPPDDDPTYESDRLEPWERTRL